MPQDKIEVTVPMIEEILGGNRFAVTGAVKAQIAHGLTKALNPPAWRVTQTDGRSTPRIKYRDTTIQLHVYSQTPAINANRTTDAAIRVAELVAECLNARGLEVE